MTSTLLRLTIPSILLAAACGDPAPEIAETAPAAQRQLPPASPPGGAIAGLTTELRVTGVDGKPVAGTEVWVLADFDPQRPSAEQRSAMAESGSNQKELARRIGRQVEAIAPGVFRVAQPKRWMFVAAQAGELSAERIVAAGVKGPVALELAPTLGLVLRVVDRAGAAVAFAELRLRVDLDEQRTVVYPLERADAQGSVDLGFLHRKLRTYADGGSSAVRLAFLPGPGKGDEPLLELAATDLPQGELTVVVRE